MNKYLICLFIGLFAPVVNAAVLDDEFDVNMDGTFISLIEVQDDQKILIGGNFFEVNGIERRYLARLNSDGSLDTSFNANINGSLDSAIVQADGKILLGGFFSSIDGVDRRGIARLNSDGSLDTSFNFDPMTSLVSGLALQSDGKILLETGISGSSLIRLNSDGTVDSSFNSNPTFVGMGGGIYKIALQTDGKILLKGSFRFDVDGLSYSDIVRLNVNGTVDTSFRYINAITDPNDILVIQADGKILIWEQGRLNTDGTADTSFAPDPFNLDANFSIRSLVLQADQKILIAGGFNSVGGVRRSGFARLNIDGTLDKSIRADSSIKGSTVALQADGKILLGGATASGISIVRLNSSGVAVSNEELCISTKAKSGKISVVCL